MEEEKKEEVVRRSEEGIREPRLGSKERVMGFFLTYPRADVPKEALLKFLKAIPNYKQSIVCEELHKDEGRHLHAWVKYSPKKQWTPTLFDFEYEGKLIHGNYQLARKPQACVEYIKKDGDFLQDNMEGNVSFMKKYSCHEILTMDPVTLVKEDAIQWHKFETLVRCQQAYKIIALPPYEHHEVRGIWLVGTPGAGKSHYAREKMIQTYGTYYNKLQNRWFNGYTGQDAILLDDMDCAKLGHMIKIWTDKYACTGESKHSYVALQHKEFVITSNKTIEEIWKDEPLMVEAIERRMKVYRRFTGKYPNVQIRDEIRSYNN